ncbi:hypothetical protein [Neobacillus sp. 19]|uniref:hypothetical protein n=1 Tax=Neobacillus sp. 19 TaxID=3394458 RepID=UPI003BF74F6F
MAKIHAGLKGLQDWESPLPLMVAGVHLNLLVGDDERALKLVGMFQAGGNYAVLAVLD